MHKRIYILIEGEGFPYSLKVQDSAWIDKIEGAKRTRHYYQGTSYAMQVEKLEEVSHIVQKHLAPYLSEKVESLHSITVEELTKGVSLS